MIPGNSYFIEARSLLSQLLYERLPATSEAFGDNSITLSRSEWAITWHLAKLLEKADGEEKLRG